METSRCRGSVLALAALFFSCSLYAQTEFGTADAEGLNREGVIQLGQRRPADAIESFKAALAACESAGTKCSSLASILTNLGSSYYSAGEYRQAEPFLARAAALSPDQDVTLHDLAAVYWAEGRASESIALNERALKLRRDRLGPSDASLLPLLTGLALAYRDSADYGRSQEMTAAAAEIADAHADDVSADAASNFIVLGSVLESQGKLARAIEWLQRGLSMSETLFGADSIASADARVFLAAAYLHERRLPEAAEAYEASIQIYDRHDARRKAAETQLSLARVLADQGKLKESERAYRSGTTRLEREFGPTDARISTGLNGLANLLIMRHQYGEAEALLRRAAEVDRANFGPGNVRVAMDLKGAGVVAMRRKQYAEAEDLFQQSAALLPTAGVESGKLEANLAELRFRQGRMAESAGLYQNALSILDPAWGPDDPQLLDIVEACAEALRQSHDVVGAARMDVRSTRIRVLMARAR
jgi:tetratricopeptide (TPR) repeat protein